MCLVSMKRALRLGLVLFVVFIVSAYRGGDPDHRYSAPLGGRHVSRSGDLLLLHEQLVASDPPLGFCYDFWTIHRALLVRGCQCRFLLSLVIFREVEGQPAVWPHLEQHQLARGF